MATSSKIHLEASQQPEFFVKGIGADTADTASELLQQNHEKHHIFFNQSGFHNHIVHHLLTLFALNATPAELKKGYDGNASYQRPPVPLEPEIVENMEKDWGNYLGKEKYYHDFLAFFQDKIDKQGWQDVLNEYVFKGDERADDMLVRMFSGFLHPIIHLGFGVEFEQPAIIAEALAQAAVHGNWIAPLFIESEKAAKKSGGVQKTVVQLLEEIKANEKITAAVRWEDGNKIRDGLLKRAPEDIIKAVSQYTVREEDLEEKTAEHINAVIYYTAASQKPPHQIKFDFYYMHCVNSSIFFSRFLTAPWLSTANKVRLLEWKVRIDLAMYASRKSPTLLLDEISEYRNNASWEDIFARVKHYPDDGHASKLVRAIAHGEKACAPWDGKDGWPIKGDMWRKLGNMAIDSVEVGDPTWVRSCGFDEAWEGIPERERPRL